LLVELGYLLMYRSGWNLGTANIVTGVFINLTLVALGSLLLKEEISFLNAAGMIISIIGVALISYRV
jgi:EamA domain-containing membrane protein RarD